MHTLTYVLITPARNEALSIERTILSVLAQRVLPSKWIIVDDGSTDNTSEIVAKYAERYSFITLIARDITQPRNFASKVDAFDAGLRALDCVPYNLLGNLDADIILGPDYYANVIAEFERDSNLGVSGGVIYVPVGETYATQDTTWDSVGGAIQLFRRECFQQIGGYLRIESGGIDAAAEIMARMHGWSVRKIANNAVYEQRRTGYSHGHPWRAAYKEGVHYHRLGYNTLFYFLRCAYRSADPQLLIGSVLGMIGFVTARIRRDSVCLPPGVVSFLHAEQMDKIKQRLVTRGRISPAY
jgi:biofilm PGA synthesis N-glycosyltransferase PgaC